MEPGHHSECVFLLFMLDNFFIHHQCSGKIRLFGQQFAFNLSNSVTDSLESSTILIYLIQLKGIYTQRLHGLKQEINKRHKKGIIAN